MNTLYTSEQANLLLENTIDEPDCCQNGEHIDRCLISHGFARLATDSAVSIKCAYCNRRPSKQISEMYALLIEGQFATGCYFCISLLITEHSDMIRLSDGEEFDAETITELYADGGLIAFKKHGGTWAWCGVDSDGKRVVWDSGVVMPPPSGNPVTNNHTEQIALIKALEAMPDGWSGTVYSDSMIALGRIFRGYGTKNLPQNIIRRSEEAVRRLGKIKTVNLKGHPSESDLRRGMGKRSDGSRMLPVSIHNLFCDKRCEYERELWREINEL